MDIGFCPWQQRLLHQRAPTTHEQYHRAFGTGRGERDAHRHGDWIWYEVMTSNPQGARAFYEKIVGWKISPDQGEPEYAMIEASEGMVGGMLTLTKDMTDHGARPCWLGYIAVDNVVARYGDAGPGPKSGVMTVAFELGGQSFTGLNGGPMFKFTEAISMIVSCETQTEVDHYWEKLSAGGQTQQCGWLKDKFGVSWQVVPTALVELICDKDPAKSQRVMQAMLETKKIDIERISRPAMADFAPTGVRLTPEKIHPARAKGGTAIASESIDHLRRYIELFLTIRRSGNASYSATASRARDETGEGLSRVP